MAYAARRADQHRCPQHEGGEIATGESGVLIGDKPAARLLDRASCGGPVDAIAEGAVGILINGLPAARRGDKTAHGGTIVEGWSNAIFSSPTVCIRVDGDEAFMLDVQRALAKLLPTRSGCVWMRQLATTGRTVTIVRNDEVGNRCDPDDTDRARNGKGTNSTIRWNPNNDVVDGHLPGSEGRPGAAIRLAHEMVHAVHYANGNGHKGPEDWYRHEDILVKRNRNEERSTVGTRGPVRQPDGTFEPNAPDYSRDVPTENSFRDDLGIPRRVTYFPTNWEKGPPW